MRKETSEWSIRMLADFKDRINVEAEYQRAKVWSPPQQSLLIDSILRGFDVPKIFLRKLPDGSPYLFDVIDGKQRLTAIWRFVADDLSLLKNADPFPELGDLSGKRWSALSNKAKDRLQFSNMTVSKLEDATDEEISELFLRLQKGEPLNAAEKRNAIAGAVRDFVVDKLAVHPIWASTGIRESRFGWHEHAAIILALSMHKGPTALKGADLLDLYTTEGFDPDGADANRAIWLLDTLHQICKSNPKCIRTRWGLVDLSIALLRLDDNNHAIDPARVLAFFENFEANRRRVSQTISDLQTKVVELSVDKGPTPTEIELSKIPPDMFRYYIAFAREGATEENVKARSEIMYRKLLDFLDLKHIGQ